MNKTAIKNFAIWARNKLIADVSYDARLIGITEYGIAKPLPQSFGDTQFFDIGTAKPYSISGEAVRQRDKLIEVIQQKEKDTDYKTAYQYVVQPPDRDPFHGGQRLSAFPYPSAIFREW